MLSFIVPSQVMGQTVFQSQNGLAAFESEVPLHSFTGTSKYLVGRISLADSTVDFYLDLATLDTGNNKRDKDMRETLNAKEYPFAEFFGSLITEFDPESYSQQSVRVKGTFTINNVSQDVEVNGVLQKTREGLAVEASWTLDLTDYNIKPPGILFYRVDEEIDIHIATTLQPIENHQSNP